MTDRQLIDKITDLNAQARQADRLTDMPTAAELRAEIYALQPEVTRRIDAAADIQTAAPLVDALFALIYGRTFADADRGPQAWRDAYQHYVARLIAAHRAHPRLEPDQYVHYLLRCASKPLPEGVIGEEWTPDYLYREIVTLLDSLLLDADSCEWTDLLHRVMARTLTTGYVRYWAHDDAWTRLMQRLIAERPPLSTMPPATRALWLRVARRMNDWYLPLDANLPELIDEVMDAS